MPPLVQLVPGQMFGRDFRVLGPLKEGGMGAVYVVDQISTGERRALKLMHLNLVADPRQRARFEQEARIGSLIRSDHIVKVIMAGVDDASGLPFLAMELLEGTELEALILSRGRIDSGELSIVLSQLCHALATAHASGIVHRDLKPENIFIATSQRADVPFTVKVLDFGIAKVIAEMKQGSSTQAMGTPVYMAPEQANPRASITPATDVWALGLVAFRALTGKLFWLGANEEEFALHAVMAEVLMHPIPPASARAAELGVGGFVPAGFDAWFAACVSRAPAERFANAGEAWRALAPILGARPSLETPVPAPASGPTGTAPGTPMPSGVLRDAVPATVRGGTQIGPLDWQGAPPAFGAAGYHSAPYVSGSPVATLQPSVVTNPGMARSGHIPALPPSASGRKSAVRMWGPIAGLGAAIAACVSGYWILGGQSMAGALADSPRRALSTIKVPSASPSAGRSRQRSIPKGKSGCAPEAELAYVLTGQSEIYSFDPPAKRFTLVAKTDCTGEGPNSMAIDRNLVMWINYIGELDTFDLKTKSGCKKIMSLPEGFTRIGMGFSLDRGGGTSETLFVDSQAGGGLAKIDPVKQELTPIAPFSNDPLLAAQSAELAGTGSGKLFACFNTTPFRIAEIDPTNANVLSDKAVGDAVPTGAWAFSLWHGDFYIYGSNDSANSSVKRYRPGDGTVETYIADAGFAIVGANVSTCASVPADPGQP